MAGADPVQIYATTKGGTWYSADAGATWKKVSSTRILAVTGDGCAVALFPVEISLQCGPGKSTISYKAPGTSQLQHLWSVASFTDRGTVLVETGSGLAEYRFRP
jgi:hypothetical protein